MGTEGTRSWLGRCVSAEVRSLIAASRISGIELSRRVGRSQNYIAKRLRDEAPFNLDDIEAIVTGLGVDISSSGTLISRAIDHNGGAVAKQMKDA